MNQRFNLKQRVAALCMAAVMCCSLFPAGAFAEAPRADADGTLIMEQDKEAVTDDSHQTEASDPDPGEESTPKSSEAAATSQSADEDKPVDDSTDYTFDGAVLYTDLPDAPTGSCMGSQGLPVATGETKIGISAWPNDQLEESTDSYLSADTLNGDDLTMMAPLLEGIDYAVAPILAQVEYPADGSSLDVVLPNEVTVLDFYGAPADEATRSRLVHSEYTETSAAVMGLYVQADADFSAQLVYTAPDGSTLTKTLHVVIDRSRTMAAPFAETTDVAAYAERPTPAVTSGKITKVEKVNGTWLIWFNGEEAYSDRLDASTNSGNYFIRELHAPLGYYLNDAEMDVTFTYDGEVLQVLDNTCANKPTEMWVSKRDLTNDEELSGATLIIKDTKENIVDTWVSTDTPHRVTGLHFDEEYTLTEKRPADGYAVADDIVFRLERKTDADGHELDEADVYYLKDKKKLWIIPWEEWELLDDATVIMKDDITRVQISKVDIATGKELPGAELVIKDKDGNMVAQWVSEDKPHYIEKLPAGDYTLTEITAPNGYQLAESIAFTVLPTGELQTVVMKDARIPEETPHEDTPSNTPQPTPGSTPAPSPAPASTPTATPTPMPVIPQTGDVFPFALLSAAVFGSIVGFGILAYKRRKSKMDESEH